MSPPAWPCSRVAHVGLVSAGEHSLRRAAVPVARSRLPQGLGLGGRFEPRRRHLLGGSAAHRHHAHHVARARRRRGHRSPPAVALLRPLRRRHRRPRRPASHDAQRAAAARGGGDAAAAPGGGRLALAAGPLRAALSPSASARPSTTPPACRSMPALVPRELLSRANSRLYAVEMAANELVGPPLGGLLVAAAIPVALAGSALGYVLAALGLTLVAGRFKPQPQGRTGLHARRHPGGHGLPVEDAGPAHDGDHGRGLPLRRRGGLRGRRALRGRPRADGSR